MRPLAVRAHHVDVFVLVHRAHQAGILVLVAADGQVHVRHCGVHGLKRRRGDELIGHLDALVRALQTGDRIGEHIALHAVLDHLVPFLAQLQDVDRLALGKRLHLQGRLALLLADGQLLRRHAQVLRVRRIVVALRQRQVDHVLGEHIARLSVLLDLGPLLAVIDDADEFAFLHAAQLFGRRGFLLSYGHRPGDHAGVQDILRQRRQTECQRKRKHQKRKNLLHGCVILDCCLSAGRARPHCRTVLQCQAIRCSLHDSLRNFLLFINAGRARSHFRTVLQCQAIRCSLHNSLRNFLWLKKRAVRKMRASARRPHQSPS